MSFSIYIEAPKGHEHDFDNLFYELVGVMDMGYAIEHTDMALVQEFFLKDHPAKSQHLKPAYIKSIDEGVQHSPFGIFIAAKDINPQSLRPLVSRQDIDAFKAKYPFLQLNKDWQNWGDVILHFKTA